MRKWFGAVLAGGLMLCAAAAFASPPGADRVLFVGNSLTYYGNLPAVYAALAQADGRPAYSDMIVTGGAALEHRVADGSVARALKARRYAALVLQERGGTLACWPTRRDCEQSRRAIQALAGLARAHGVAAVLLGTYVPVDGEGDLTPAVVRLEAEAAAAAGIPYLPVHDTLTRARQAAPGLNWFAADGMHPGRDLTLLNALLVFQWRHGSPPTPADLAVPAPIYGQNSELEPVWRPADAPAPTRTTPREGRYAEATVRQLVGVVSAEPRPAAVPR